MIKIIGGICMLFIEGSRVVFLILRLGAGAVFRLQPDRVGVHNEDRPRCI